MGAEREGDADDDGGFGGTAHGSFRRLGGLKLLPLCLGGKGGARRVFETVLGGGKVHFFFVVKVDVVGSRGLRLLYFVHRRYLRNGHGQGCWG